MNPLSAQIALMLVSLAGVPGEISLFNGKDLDGWKAEGVHTYASGGAVKPVWSVSAGELLCKGCGFGFLRYDRRQFTDFVLHAEFLMAPGCNSGLGIRTGPFDPARSRATRPSFHGYEIQLLDDGGQPATRHSSGSLYRYLAPRKNAIRTAGQWNSIDVECVGSRIKVVLNGVEIIDLDQATIPELRGKPLAGYLCLQNHGGDIRFRSIRVRDLAGPRPGSPEAAPVPRPRFGELVP